MHLCSDGPNQERAMEKEGSWQWQELRDGESVWHGIYTQNGSGWEGGDDNSGACKGGDENPCGASGRLLRRRLGGNEGTSCG